MNTPYTRAIGFVMCALVFMVGGFVSTSPAIAQVTPTEELKIRIERVGNPSRSEERSIARIHVVGGKIGPTFQPFPQGLVVAVLAPKVAGVTVGGIREDLAQVKLFDGVATTSATVLEKSNGYYLLSFPRPTAYAVTVAGQDKVYRISYKPVLLAEDQPLQIGLLNGATPFPKLYSHYDNNKLLYDPLGSVYKVIYETPLFFSPAVTVVNGKDFTTIREYLAGIYNITVYDHNRLPLVGLQLIKSTLDSIGVNKLPTHLQGIRIRPYIAPTEGSGPWLRNDPYQKPDHYVSMMVHELHHQVNRQLASCGVPSTDSDYIKCRASSTADRTFFANLGKRIPQIIKKAGTDGNNYVRTNITLRTLDAKGRVTSTSPETSAEWAATFETRVGRGDVYTLQPYITFTSGALVGKGDFEVDDYLDGLITLTEPPPQTPAIGDTFVIRGGGGDFFFKREQEFFASLSQPWFNDTSETWAKCIASYRLGRPIVVDQCLLFADLYGKDSSTTPFFKTDAAGNITKTSQAVTRNTQGRIVGIPGAGPEKFNLDAEGLVQFTRGDVNIDTKITAADALAVMRVAVQQVPSKSLMLEDVTCSDGVTVSDAYLLLKTAVGLKPTPIVCDPSTVDTQIPKIVVLKSGSGLGIIEPVTLTAAGSEITFGFKASANKRSVFKGWTLTGVSAATCTGTVAECRFTTNGLAPITLTAQFDSDVSLAAAVAEAFSTLSPSMMLLVLCEILFFLSFGLHYFYPSHKLALGSALLAFLTALLMLVNGLIG
jgi:hypothetical protein